MNTSDLKLPPQDVEMEQAVLSSVLLDASQADAVTDILDPHDFYRAAHQKIFTAICDLNRKKEPIDIVTVMNRLREAEKLEETGGGTYLSQITETPVATNIEYYCRKLKELATLRNIITICNKSAQACYCSHDPVETIDQIQKEILSVNLPTGRPWVTQAQLADETVERYEALMAGENLSIPTGYFDIDLALRGGFAPKKLVVIGARPSVGKTALMVNLIRNQAEKGYCIGVMELEMDRGELADRWNSILTGINSLNFSTGTGPNQNQWDALVDAQARQYDWRVLTDDTGGIPIAEVKRRARLMVKEGAQIIYIDQLSKISGNRKLSDYERNTIHVQEIESLKKELGIPIVLLCQVNRVAEQRPGKKPTLADLKSTGRIEEDADIIFLGCKEKIYVNERDGNGTKVIELAQWEMAKNRGGPTRDFYFRYYGKTTKFVGITQDAYATVKAREVKVNG